VAIKALGLHLLGDEGLTIERFTREAKKSMAASITPT
jgi:hypothetical protein